MAERVTYEIAEGETLEKMHETMKPYREVISKNPALESLLYDIDLLPEQIKLPINVFRMVAVAELYKQLSTDQIASLFTPAK